MRVCVENDRIFLFLEQQLNEEKFNAIFNQFDTDGTGTISRENIITAMNKMG